MGPQYATMQCQGAVYELDGSLSNKVLIDMSWAVADPFALGIMFGAEDGENTWYVAIDLFLKAAETDNSGKYIGDGDVKVRFVGPQCWMLFRTNEDCAIVRSPSSRVIPFLLEVGRLRQENADAITELVNRELNSLLEAA